MQPTSVGTGRPRILVVDDSAIVRAVVRAGLGAFDVEEAVDGLAAVAKLGESSYDVVVTDLDMPGLDGFGVLAAAKAMPGGPEVIILTGARADDVQSALKAMRLGAHDFLTKPPSRPGEVALTVEKALEKKRLREDNARLMQDMEALSRTDGLTGLLNRRAFDSALEMETARTRRNGSPLSLVMFDIDHFKKVNDAHGHPGGDVVLMAFARVLRETVRETDVVYRFGGEEFTAILPDTTPGGALKAAARVLEAWRHHPVAVGDHTVNATASAGVATAYSAHATAPDLLSRADQALYQAKELGRDQATIAAAAGPAPIARARAAPVPSNPSPWTVPPAPGTIKALGAPSLEGEDVLSGRAGRRPS